MITPDPKPAIAREVLGREARLRELGQVTGELLHDLAGTLAVLNGRIALAREEAALGKVPTDELNRIGADAEELRRMVLEILAELRGMRPSAEATFPVVATLEGVVKRWLVGAPHVSAALRATLPPEAAIAGQRSFFTRAMGNLLRNAARHARSEIRLSAAPAGDGRSVDIRVEDDGEGIPPGLREVIFEPFITGTKLGTGLGLSFARWGIERLGGTLSLDPSPSGLGGAGFHVRLPLSTLGRRRSRPTADASPPLPHAGPTPLQGVRVAVVDDDERVRSTFLRLLSRSGAVGVGVDPREWTSLSDGVEQVAASIPDAILLDLTLDPYEGLDLTRLLRERAPHLLERVVYFTGAAAHTEPLDRPLLSKLAPWEEVVARILEVADR